MSARRSCAAWACAPRRSIIARRVGADQSIRRPPVPTPARWRARGSAAPWSSPPRRSAPARRSWAGRRASTRRARAAPDVVRGAAAARVSTAREAATDTSAAPLPTCSSTDTESRPRDLRDPSGASASRGAAARPTPGTLIGAPPLSRVRTPASRRRRLLGSRSRADREPRRPAREGPGGRGDGRRSWNPRRRPSGSRRRYRTRPRTRPAPATPRGRPCWRLPPRRC